jgi:hypothetical protein
MRKQVISFKVPQIKHRAHYVLFAEGSPFKAKAEKRKDVYKRKPRNQRQDSDWQ